MRIQWSVLWQKDFPLFTVLVAISVVLAAAGRFAGVGTVSNLLGYVFLPFEAFSSQVMNLTYVSEENGVLRARLAEASQENALLKEQVYEVDRLRRLLDFRGPYPVPMAACRVVAEIDERLGGGIVVDRGYSGGLARNMTVISPDGLVGLVVRSSAGVSTVKRIVDPGSRISASLQATRATGILRARGDGRVFMDWVPPDAAVEPGDTVISSGLGSVVPKGIPVGLVASVEDDISKFSLSLEVLPFVDFERLEEVFVLTSRPTAIEVSPEEIGSVEVGR